MERPLDSGRRGFRLSLFGRTVVQAERFEEVETDDMVGGGANIPFGFSAERAVEEEGAEYDEEDRAARYWLRRGRR